MINFWNSLKRLSLMSLLLLTGAGVAQAQHSVGLTTGITLEAGGEAKQLEISLTSASTDIYMVTGYIALPSGFNYEAVGTNSNGVSMYAGTTSRTDGFLVSLARRTGYWQVASTAKKAISGTEGAISVIKVAAGETVAPGEYTIELSNFTVYHQDGTNETAETANVTVTVVEATPEPAAPIAFSPATISLNAGETTTVDVVMKNEVALVDFEALVSATDGLTIDVVGATSYSRKKVKVAEIAANAGTLFKVSITAGDGFNGEGTVTLSNIMAYDVDEAIEDPYSYDDITLTITKQQEPEGESLSFAFSETSLMLSAGEEKSVEVSMTNDFTASVFMAQLALPEGITATVEASERMTGELKYENGVLLSYGDIARGEGAIFTLKLTADENFAGEGVVTLKKLAVSTKQSKQIEAEDITLTVQTEVKTLSFAFAEEELTLDADKRASVEVAMTNSFTASVFMAQLELPEGVTATLEKSERMTGELRYKDGVLLSFGDIAAGEGTIFTLTLTADDGFEGEGVVTLKKPSVSDTRSNEYTADDIALTIKLQEDVYTLDETSDEPIVAGEYAKMVLKRVFRQGWNTVCLPFEVASVAEFFGEEATAYEFSGFEGGSLQFTVMSGDAVKLESGKPYVVYVPEVIDEKELTNVTIVDKPQAVSRGEARFVGTFAPKKAGEMEGKYGVTDDAHIAKGSSKASIDGFRAYFELPAGTSGARLMLCDETTGLAKVVKEAATGNDTLYNIGGLRVAQPTKAGIYIREGKKVIIK